MLVLFRNLPLVPKKVFPGQTPMCIAYLFFPRACYMTYIFRTFMIYTFPYIPKYFPQHFVRLHILLVFLSPKKSYKV
jgi:hypothetical protein